MPKVNDLTGQRFGKLTVIGHSNEYKDGKRLWECKCDCGNVVSVRGSSLTRGNTKSCGCRKKNDLIGQVFGKLTVTSITDKRKGTSIVWECRCDCGKICFVSGASLKSGRKSSCGCVQSEKTDLRGKRFGKLTAVQPTAKRINRSIVWECKCDCGRVAYVAFSNLRNGSTKSCGCLNKEDLTGLRFGRLEVLKLVGLNECKKRIWECRCDCGNLTTVIGQCLTNGDTKSCRCYRHENGVHYYSENLQPEYVMGTCLKAIQEDEGKLRKTNSTGVKGVYYSARQDRYVATLVFQRIRLIRTCKTLDEAAEMRRKMKAIHEEFLEWWNSISEEEKSSACAGFESERLFHKEILKKRVSEL